MNSAQLLATLRPDSSTSPEQAIEAVYATGHWLLTADRVADAAKVFRLLLRVAPADERGWLALGQCHERINQPNVAAELYGAGSFASPGSVRCLVARARLLRESSRAAEAAADLEEAERRAEVSDDEELEALVSHEKGGES